MPGGRGGRRAGTPGTTYSQRSDLNANRAVAITAPTGMPYGARQAEIQSQQAVPIRPSPGPTVPPPSAPVPGAPQPPPLGPPPVQPGGLPALDRPSERPGEHVLSGAPVGPGPGPEALGLGQSPQTVGDLLSRIGSYSPEVAALLARTQQGNL